MRKREREEAAEAARRRLTQLGMEVGRIGEEAATADTPVDDDVPMIPSIVRAQRSVLRMTEPRPEPPPPVVPLVPGRHARASLGGSWLTERLPAALRGRVDFGAHHAGLILGALGVALALAGWVALHSGAEETPVRAVVSSEEVEAPNLKAASVPDGASSATPKVAGEVVVDVAGKVRKPGIVTLPSGSRVQDALAEAGGVKPGVRLGTLNRARVLVDGEQILVGQSPLAAGGTGPGVPGSGVPGSGVPGSGVAGSGGQGAAGSPMINLNSAGLTELQELPGVGPVTAQKILDWRSAHGAFTSVDELLEVDGIGDKTLAEIAPHATL